VKRLYGSLTLNGKEALAKARACAGPFDFAMSTTPHHVADRRRYERLAERVEQRHISKADAATD
jgi:hypothetical protein